MLRGKAREIGQARIHPLFLPSASLDFSTLHKLPSEYIGEGLHIRRADTVWRVQGRNGWLHVLVLLEFQSSDEPEMALRILEYTAMLYRELRRNKATDPDERLPPVLPVVLYNGAAPWKSAVEVGELIADTGPAFS